MSRLAVLLLLISLPATCCAADEYVLRAEHFQLLASNVKYDAEGRVAATTMLGNPSSSVEVRVERDSPFDVLLKHGTESIEFRGHVSRVAPGKPQMKVEVEYANHFLASSADSAVTTRKVATSVVPHLDQRLCLAGLMSRRNKEPEKQDLIFLTIRKADRFDVEHAAALSRRAHGQPLNGACRVRLSGLGFVARPVETQELGLNDLDLPNAKPRFTVDVTATSGKPFQVRAQFARIDLKFAGIFYPAKVEKKLDVAFSLDESQIQMGQDQKAAKKDPTVKDKTAISSLLEVDLNKPLALGGMVSLTANQRPNGTVQSLQTNLQYQLQVTKAPAR